MEKWKFQTSAVYLFGTKQKHSETEGVPVVLESGDGWGSHLSEQ